MSRLQKAFGGLSKAVQKVLKAFARLSEGLNKSVKKTIKASGEPLKDLPNLQLLKSLLKAFETLIDSLPQAFEKPSNYV